MDDDDVIIDDLDLEDLEAEEQRREKEEERDTNGFYLFYKLVGSDVCNCSVSRLGKKIFHDYTLLYMQLMRRLCPFSYEGNYEKVELNSLYHFRIRELENFPDIKIAYIYAYSPYHKLQLQEKICATLFLNFFCKTAYYVLNYHSSNKMMKLKLVQILYILGFVEPNRSEGNYALYITKEGTSLRLTTLDKAKEYNDLKTLTLKRLSHKYNDIWVGSRRGDMAMDNRREKIDSFGNNLKSRLGLSAVLPNVTYYKDINVIDLELGINRTYDSWYCSREVEKTVQDEIFDFGPIPTLSAFEYDQLSEISPVDFETQKLKDLDFTTSIIGNFQIPQCPHLLCLQNNTYNVRELKGHISVVSFVVPSLSQKVSFSIKYIDEKIKYFLSFDDAQAEISIHQLHINNILSLPMKEAEEGEKFFNNLSDFTERMETRSDNFIKSVANDNPRTSRFSRNDAAINGNCETNLPLWMKPLGLYYGNADNVRKIMNHSMGKCIFLFDNFLIRKFHPVSTIDYFGSVKDVLTVLKENQLKYYGTENFRIDPAMRSIDVDLTTRLFFEIHLYINIKLRHSSPEFVNLVKGDRLDNFIREHPSHVNDPIHRLEDGLQENLEILNEYLGDSLHSLQLSEVFDSPHIFRERYFNLLDLIVAKFIDKLQTPVVNIIGFKRYLRDLLILNPFSHLIPLWANAGAVEYNLHALSFCYVLSKSVEWVDGVMENLIIRNANFSHPYLPLTIKLICDRIMFTLVKLVKGAIRSLMGNGEHVIGRNYADFTVTLIDFFNKNILERKERVKVAEAIHSFPNFAIQMFEHQQSVALTMLDANLNLKKVASSVSTMQKYTFVFDMSRCDNDVSIQNQTIERFQGIFIKYNFINVDSYPIANELAYGSYISRTEIEYDNTKEDGAIIDEKIIAKMMKKSMEDVPNDVFQPLCDFLHRPLSDYTMADFFFAKVNSEDYLKPRKIAEKTIHKYNSTLGRYNFQKDQNESFFFDSIRELFKTFPCVRRDISVKEKLDVIQEGGGKFKFTKDGEVCGLRVFLLNVVNYTLSSSMDKKFIEIILLHLNNAASILDFDAIVLNYPGACSNSVFDTWEKFEDKTDVINKQQLIQDYITPSSSKRTRRDEKSEEARPLIHFQPLRKKEEEEEEEEEELKRKIPQHHSQTIELLEKQTLMLKQEVMSVNDETIQKRKVTEIENINTVILKEREARNKKEDGNVMIKKNDEDIDAIITSTPSKRVRNISELTFQKEDDYERKKTLPFYDTNMEIQFLERKSLNLKREGLSAGERGEGQKEKIAKIHDINLRLEELHQQDIFSPRHEKEEDSLEKEDSEIYEIYQITPKINVSSSTSSFSPYDMSEENTSEMLTRVGEGQVAAATPLIPSEEKKPGLVSVSEEEVFEDMDIAFTEVGKWEEEQMEMGSETKSGFVLGLEKEDNQKRLGIVQLLKTEREDEGTFLEVSKEEEEIEVAEMTDVSSSEKNLEEEVKMEFESISETDGEEEDETGFASFSEIERKVQMHGEEDSASVLEVEEKKLFELEDEKGSVPMSEVGKREITQFLETGKKEELEPAEDNIGPVAVSNFYTKEEVKTEEDVVVPETDERVKTWRETDMATGERKEERAENVASLSFPKVNYSQGTHNVRGYIAKEETKFDNVTGAGNNRGTREEAGILRKVGEEVSRVRLDSDFENFVVTPNREASVLDWGDIRDKAARSTTLSELPLKVERECDRSVGKDFFSIPDGCKNLGIKYDSGEHSQMEVEEDANERSEKGANLSWWSADSKFVKSENDSSEDVKHLPGTSFDPETGLAKRRGTKQLRREVNDRSDDNEDEMSHRQDSTNVQPRPSFVKAQHFDDNRQQTHGDNVENASGKVYHEDTLRRIDTGMRELERRIIENQQALATRHRDDGITLARAVDRVNENVTDCIEGNRNIRREIPDMERRITDSQQRSRCETRKTGVADSLCHSIPEEVQFLLRDIKSQLNTMSANNNLAIKEVAGDVKEKNLALQRIEERTRAVELRDVDYQNRLRDAIERANQPLMDMVNSLSRDVRESERRQLSISGNVEQLLRNNSVGCTEPRVLEFLNNISVDVVRAEAERILNKIECLMVDNSASQRLHTTNFERVKEAIRDVKANMEDANRHYHNAFSSRIDRLQETVVNRIDQVENHLSALGDAQHERDSAAAVLTKATNEALVAEVKAAAASRDRLDSETTRHDREERGTRKREERPKETDRRERQLAFARKVNLNKMKALASYYYHSQNLPRYLAISRAREEIQTSVVDWEELPENDSDYNILPPTVSEERRETQKETTEWCEKKTGKETLSALFRIQEDLREIATEIGSLRSEFNLKDLEEEGLVYTNHAALGGLEERLAQKMLAGLDESSAAIRALLEGFEHDRKTDHRNVVEKLREYLEKQSKVTETIKGNKFIPEENTSRIPFYPIYRASNSTYIKDKIKRKKEEEGTMRVMPDTRYTPLEVSKKLADTVTAKTVDRIDLQEKKEEREGEETTTQQEEEEEEEEEEAAERSGRDCDDKIFQSDFFLLEKAYRYVTRKTCGRVCPMTTSHSNVSVLLKRLQELSDDKLRKADYADFTTFEYDYKGVLEDFSYSFCALSDKSQKNSIVMRNHLASFIVTVLICDFGVVYEFNHLSSGTQGDDANLFIDILTKVISLAPVSTCGTYHKVLQVVRLFLKEDNKNIRSVSERFLLKTIVKFLVVAQSRWLMLDSLFDDDPYSVDTTLHDLFLRKHYNEKEKAEFRGTGVKNCLRLAKEQLDAMETYLGRKGENINLSLIGVCQNARELLTYRELARLDVFSFAAPIGEGDVRLLRQKIVDVTDGRDMMKKYITNLKFSFPPVPKVSSVLQRSSSIQSRRRKISEIISVQKLMRLNYLSILEIDRIEKYNFRFVLENVDIMSEDVRSCEQLISDILVGGKTPHDHSSYYILSPKFNIKKNLFSNYTVTLVQSPSTVYDSNSFAEAVYLRHKEYG